MKRMPVVFLGHGSPMLAISHNSLTKKINEVGNTIIEKFGKPKAILAISAHWATNENLIQSSENPNQIYDMYGFPQELYDLRYPVKGDINLTNEVKKVIDNVKVNDSWGIDHGSWSVLVHMFPKADIPVVQLSVNVRLSTKEIFEIGKKLTTLRDLGYLIIGSGNIVHNLYEADFLSKDGSIQNKTFASQINSFVENSEYDKVLDYRNLKYNDYAAPTSEHFLPLIYILGASDNDKPTSFNNVCDLSSISMSSFIFGLE